MTGQQPFTEILTKLRRCARNGERLHLEPEHVMALLASPVYPELARLEAEEMAQQRQSKAGSASSGSRGALTAANGLSAGTTELLDPDVESQLVSAITMKVIRQSKHNKRSPPTSPTTARQKKSTQALRIVSPES